MLHTKKNAFTMIELVFVIVVLGILAAVAVPKFSATRDDAVIAKGRSNVASIRSGIISERQARLIKGDSDFIPNGTGVGQMGHGGLFGGVLMYPISPSTGNDGWSATAGSGTYVYKVAGSANTFKYTPADGKFLCVSGNECDKLTK